MRRKNAVNSVIYAASVTIALFFMAKLFLSVRPRQSLWQSVGSLDLAEPYKLLVDPYRFRWTILEKNFCTELEPHTKYLIVMHTAPENFEKRRAYRRMYGDQFFQGKGVRLLFTLGHARNRLVKELIKNESARRHDIIQQNFVDSYRNLTWKALMFLRFVKEYCHHVRYVISTDDDVLINLWELIRILKMYPLVAKSKEELERTIFCKILYHQKVIRDPLNKWYQSRAECPSDFYKDYCAALAIIIPGALINSLFEASINETFHRFDDYFLTGILARKVGVLFKDISKKAYNHVNMKDRKAFLSRRIYFQATDTVNQAEEMWNAVKRHYDLRRKRYFERIKNARYSQGVYPQKQELGSWLSSLVAKR